jgi:hypothetical protein
LEAWDVALYYLGAVSRDELCQIVLHQGLNEPARKLE